MLSSTSLLHGNCIFNRNNTVATQQGMKTYWLCKSYRISMCRARCITHQGRVISATGVHNHAPHMKNPPANSGSGDSSGQTPPPQPIVISTTAATPVTSSQTIRIVPQSIANSMVQQHQTSSSPHLMVQHNSQPQVTQYQGPQVSHHIVGPQTITATQVQQQPTAVIQNMMQNVLTSNNLMHQHHLATSIHGLTNIGPILNPLQQHQHHVLTNIHAPPSLQITPVVNAHHIQPSPTGPHHGSHLRATVLPPQQTVVHSQIESPSMAQQQQQQQHPSTICSTPNSVVIQSNPTMSQSQQGGNVPSHNEDSEQSQQESSHQQSAGNNGGMIQTIEMAPQQQIQHNQQNFKMEHI